MLRAAKSTWKAKGGEKKRVLTSNLANDEGRFQDVDRGFELGFCSDLNANCSNCVIYFCLIFVHLGK